MIFAVIINLMRYFLYLADSFLGNVVQLAGTIRLLVTGCKNYLLSYSIYMTLFLLMFVNLKTLL